eukprot:TRINITY_DN1902_c0_g1_i5.p2 TRINITY_DN1902_c0_g1~~TRINITY_DN1902_c0_g1_i5.p2  ORF type:complete len:131 (+),score=8.96 TRINITY_DN1902_c0_g1_i5:755-1147(+)
MCARQVKHVSESTIKRVPMYIFCCCTAAAPQRKYRMLAIISGVEPGFHMALLLLHRSGINKAHQNWHDTVLQVLLFCSWALLQLGTTLPQLDLWYKTLCKCTGKLLWRSSTYMTGDDCVCQSICLQPGIQ